MTRIAKLKHFSIIVAFTLSAAIASCAVTGAPGKQSATIRLVVETIHLKLAEGDANVDLYWPTTNTPAPLVIVAHGFSRHRHNMSGWGKHLSKAGLVVAVPDLPAWSDHARNARFISDLREYLSAGEFWRQRIDPLRVGLMGFSAGGLSSLLSAADSPALSIWVGLDPVDRNGIGAKAAALVKCRAVVLTAEPSACNAHGNARGIVAVLPYSEHLSVTGATHVDAEWPTDWMAEFVCGRSTDEKRRKFRQHATTVLLDALVNSPVIGTQMGAK